MDLIGVALTRALAPEIGVMTVSPGVVDSDFVPGRDRSARENRRDYAIDAALHPAERRQGCACLRRDAAVLDRQCHSG